MSWATQEVVGLLTYLLPGFLAAWIFFGLTAFPKPAPFERIVQALIFTALVQGVVLGVEQVAYVLGRRLQSTSVWTENHRILWALLVATLLGVGFAYLANSDTLHRLLRHLKITKETSLPSEWYGNFAEHQTYVVLHLSGRRRLYGWPNEWPSQPAAGHFALSRAEWLTDENDKIPLEGVTTILVPADEVSFVEFMESKLPKEQGNDQESTDASTAASPG